MSKLLLPYALNNDGELIHIDNANKNEIYICPNCGAELSLRKSKIPEGEKYHRRNHFAHKGSSDNHCSESFLHKLFKDKCTEFISDKIRNKESFSFEWSCDRCGEMHSGNLLKKAVQVYSEYDMGVCKPDIALLDKDGKVIIVIEVVVTHKPEEPVVRFYDENKIACLQINVTDFLDCDKVNEKLGHPDHVNICPNPICNVCKHVKQKVKMVIVTTECWRCGEKMKAAIIEAENGNRILSPSEFSQEEINIAVSNGVNIKNRYSKTVNSSYYANVCNRCNAFLGDFYMHDLYYLPHDKDIALGYRCFNCMDVANEQAYQKELEESRKKEELFMELKSLESTKVCPRCGKRLKLRSSSHGLFWGCEDYPVCKYTENINTKK